MVHVGLAGALLAIALTCSHSADVCNEGDSGCVPEAPEDASLLQLVPGKGKGTLELVHTQVETHGHLKCPKGDTPAILGRLDDKDLQLNWPAYTPLDVPAGSSLTLLVCNLGNTGDRTPATTPMTSFVGSVGAGAHVYVLVASSFNVRAAGNVLIGPPITPRDQEILELVAKSNRQDLDAQRQEWDQASANGECPNQSRRRRRRRRTPSALLELEEEKERDALENKMEEEVTQGQGKEAETEKEKGKEQAEKAQRAQKKGGAKRQRSHQGQMGYLVPPAVAGPVGKGAVIQVTVKDSGNVETARGNVELHNVTLVGPAVYAWTYTLETVTVQVGSFNSGNVMSAGNLTMVGATLLSLGIETGGFRGVQGRVHWEGSGKVEAKVLTLLGGDATITGPAFDAPEALESTFGLTLVLAALFQGKDLSFLSRPPYVEPLPQAMPVLILVFQVKGCRFDISISSTANFDLAGDILGGGSLLGEVLGAEELSESRVELTMLNSANLQARDWYVDESPGPRLPLWVDDLIDVDGAENLESVKVHVGNSANLKVGRLALHSGGDERAALRRAVYLGDYIEPSRKVNVEVTIDDSANWQGKLLVAREAEFNLIQHAIEIRADDVVSAHLSVSMSRTGNVNGTIVCLADELFDEPIEGENFNHSTIVAVLRDSACVKATRFEMEEEDLIDEVVDVDDLFDTQVRVVVNSVGNVEAETAVLRDSAELIEVVMDGDDLLAGSAVDLLVTNCGNLIAEDVTMSDESYLIEDIMQGVWVTPVPVSIAVASSGNLQANARLDDRSRLVDHIINPSDTSPRNRTCCSNFGDVSITLTESASLKTADSRLKESSYLLGVVVDEVNGPPYSSQAPPTDLSLLKSFSMFATAVASDQVDFRSGSGPCEQSDLNAFAVPFAHSCVPMP